MNGNPGILFVANFPPGTGYAWNVIESYFGALASTGRALGFDTYACYPGIESAESLPSWTRETSTKIIEIDFGHANLRNIVNCCEFLRKKQIRVLYLVDQDSWAFRYLFFRLGGVKKIIIHDHTSGERAEPVGVKRVFKALLHRNALLCADLYIGVSRFVAERLIRVNRVPSRKVHVVYNGVDLDRFIPSENDLLRNELGIDSSKKIVFSSGRAVYYKGIHILIDAAELLLCNHGRRDLAFVYAGDGPDFEDLKRRAKTAGILNDFYFLGKRDDIHCILPGSDIVIVPSIWQEAFGLTVIEAMACGKPVIASRVGGISEIVEDGKSGMLIPPGEPALLARAIENLVTDDQKRRQIGTQARTEVKHFFNINRTITALKHIFEEILKDLPK